MKIFGSIERERIPNAQEECTRNFHFHWFSYVTIIWLIGKLNHCNNKLLTVSLRVWALHAQIKKKNRKVSIQNQIVWAMAIIHGSLIWNWPERYLFDPRSARIREIDWNHLNPLRLMKFRSIRFSQVFLHSAPKPFILIPNALVKWWIMHRT